ncbi:MAG TPA: peptidylprolyl isomerase [Candidatus Baltobacteraceae bacterium]|nr:peptidylprolyl isomerase [Candidatus Baltobacteraceae bacterium]
MANEEHHHAEGHVHAEGHAHTHGGEAHHHTEAQKPKAGGIKPVHAIGIIIAIVIIIGVVYVATSSSASAATVAVGDNVSVIYTGTLTNGTVFDSNVGGAPLNFTVGAGQMIQGFDQGVVGMKLNEDKTLTLPPAEAYGNVNPALVVTLPRSQLGNLTVAVGTRLQSSNGQVGVVKSVNETNVTIDFNSELAGQTLIFQVKVVSIKK